MRTLTTPDIIDTIDELVDGQLAGGEPETDYNYGDPQFPRCPHCQRHWHGLPITQRIAHMYTHGTYDQAYVAAEDDSPVLCRGSDFIGPMPAEGQVMVDVVEAIIQTGVNLVFESLSAIFGVPAFIELSWPNPLMPEITSASESSDA